MPFSEEDDFDAFDDGGADYCRICGEECHGDHEDHDPEEPPYDEEDDRSEFADPGGESALRASSRSNPRNLPCPACHATNVLTPKDQALGYQCDACATATERGYDRDYVCGGSENGCVLCKKSEEESGTGEEEEEPPRPAIWDGKTSAGGTYERGE